MAGDLKSKYGTSNQAITMSLSALANSGALSSAAIDNSTNLFMDALVEISTKTDTTGVSATGVVNLYAVGTADGGTTYAEGTGAHAAITMTNPPNAKLIGVVSAVANNTVYKGGPFSVANAFGGILPDHWAVIVENRTGAILMGTTTVHSVFYQGVYGQYT
jgi:hypothetical protein